VVQSIMPNSKPYLFNHSRKELSYAPGTNAHATSFDADDHYGNRL
jgi:hypothetical protein